MSQCLARPLKSFYNCKWSFVYCWAAPTWNVSFVKSTLLDRYNTTQSICSLEETRWMFCNSSNANHEYNSGSIISELHSYSKIDFQSDILSLESSSFCLKIFFNVMFSALIIFLPPFNHPYKSLTSMFRYRWFWVLPGSRLSIYCRAARNVIHFLHIDFPCFKQGMHFSSKM